MLSIVYHKPMSGEKRSGELKKHAIDFYTARLYNIYSTFIRSKRNISLMRFFYAWMTFIRKLLGMTLAQEACDIASRYWVHKPRRAI